MIELDCAFVELAYPAGFQIVSHNIQGIQAHIDQIMIDPVYLSCGLISLNETWMLSPQVPTLLLLQAMDYLLNQEYVSFDQESLL